jgi:phage gpG-like protein
MAGQAIDLAKLPQVLKAGKIDPGRAKTAFFKNARMLLISETKKCFDEGRSPDGQVWLPVKHPRVRGSGTPVPLRDTGILMASVTAKSHENRVDRESGNTLEWGTNAIQANLMQYGGTIYPKNKYLTIPVSIEALRAGSPLRFPQADKRLKWACGEKGGIVYEVLTPSKKANKPKGKYNHIYTKVRDADVIIHFYAVTEVTVPARPFVGFTPAMAEKLARIASEYVEKTGSVLTSCC